MQDFLQRSGNLSATLYGFDAAIGRVLAFLYQRTQLCLIGLLDQMKRIGKTKSGYYINVARVLLIK